MRYKDSIVEVILIERERGKTYKEIAEKLDISIYKVKKAVYGERITKEKKPRTRKNKKSDLDV